MDGKIVIGTDIDTSGLEEGLVDIEQITKRIEEKIGRSITNAEKNNLEKELSGTNETLKRFYDKLQEYYDAYAEAGSGGIIFKSDVERVAQLKQDLKDMIPIVEELTGDKIILPGINDTEKKIPKIDLGLGKIVKKIAQWGLALFGIRSAYSAIRSAMSTISQNDEQLKADIDYMKNALAYVLEPVVRRIVEWAKQLVFYIGYLIKAWTEHDIFASANKNLKKTVGSAKELKKQLAGFDEMNVISDNSGGAGGGAMPSFNFEDMEAPKWLETITEKGRWILDNWEDVVSTLLLIKMFFDIITGNWVGVFFDAIALIILALKKMWDAIQVIKDNFLEGMKVLGALIVLHIKNKLKGLLELLALLWQKIKDGVSSAIQWIKDKFNSIKDFFRSIIDTIIGFFKTIGTKVGDAVGGAFKGVINTVLEWLANKINGFLGNINSAIDYINKIPLVNIPKLKMVSFPRLAKGGVINMPGRGVPVGSAIGGERGQEGVIPLTDSQQMALLGEAIGKYISLNATIPVYVGNRMVAREIKRINAEDNFAYNR